MSKISALLVLIVAVGLGGCLRREAPAENAYYGYEIEEHGFPTSMMAKVAYRVPFTITNTGTGLWRKQSDIMVGFHLMDPSGTRFLVHGFAKRQIDATAAPGETITLWPVFHAPAEPGEYLVVVDMLHDRFAWFEERGAEPLRLPLKVVPHDDDEFRRATLKR